MESLEREFERDLLHKDDGRVAGDRGMGSLGRAWGIGKVKVKADSQRQSWKRMQG